MVDSWQQTHAGTQARYSPPPRPEPMLVYRWAMDDPLACHAGIPYRNGSNREQNWTYILPRGSRWHASLERTIEFERGCFEFGIRKRSEIVCILHATMTGPGRLEMRTGERAPVRLRGRDFALPTPFDDYARIRRSAILTLVKPGQCPCPLQHRLSRNTGTSRITIYYYGLTSFAGSRFMTNENHGKRCQCSEHILSQSWLKISAALGRWLGSSLMMSLNQLEKP